MMTPEDLKNYNIFKIAIIFIDQAIIDGKKIKMEDIVDFVFGHVDRSEITRKEIEDVIDNETIPNLIKNLM